jgi:hypothetical protein
MRQRPHVVIHLGRIALIDPRPAQLTPIKVFNILFEQFTFIRTDEFSVPVVCHQLRPIFNCASSCDPEESRVASDGHHWLATQRVVAAFVQSASGGT